MPPAPTSPLREFPGTRFPLDARRQQLRQPEPASCVCSRSRSFEDVRTDLVSEWEDEDENGNHIVAPATNFNRSSARLTPSSKDQFMGRRSMENLLIDTSPQLPAPKRIIPGFQIQGQIHHRIGSLQPIEDEQHKFLQIYFMGNMDEQLDGCQEINTAMERAILQDLQQLLHEHHALVSLFKTALERMPNDDYKVVIRADKRPAETHERTFNAPTIDEVAILIVGENLETRDIKENLKMS